MATDEDAVKSITGMFGTSMPSIEQRIWLADCRARDAIWLATKLAHYIINQEKKYEHGERDPAVSGQGESTGS